MTGCMFALISVTLWYIPKAILEVAYFKDRQDAKNSLFLWLVSAGSIGFAMVATLFFDYFT